MSSVIRGDDNIDSADLESGRAKAWVNFNGTGTVAIRKAFNVSSITDNGLGYYAINFTTSISDPNYVPIVSTADTSRNATGHCLNVDGSVTNDVNTLNIASQTFAGTGVASYDSAHIFVAVFD